MPIGDWFRNLFGEPAAPPTSSARPLEVVKPKPAPQKLAKELPATPPPSPRDAEEPVKEIVTPYGSVQFRISVRTESSPVGPPPVVQDRPGRSRQSGSAKWIQSQDSVTVAGRSIRGGLFYFGTNFASVDQFRTEPSLVDPKLPVDWSSPDFEGAGLGYWSSYEAFSPRERAAYLLWLDSGRSISNINIGYVFVFYYGLERRLLVDSQMTDEDPVLLEMISEIIRLRSRQSNYSFLSYSLNLLEFIAASGGPRIEIVEEPEPAARGDGTPLAIRLAIGEAIAANQHVPPTLALRYLKSHPLVFFRTPARRCRPQFDALFQTRYVREYGEGMLIKPPRRAISVTYRPASSGLGGARKVVCKVPDIDSISGPINKLKALSDVCTDELDSFSRFLGKSPDAADSPDALALLPSELLRAASSVRPFQDWLEQRVDKESGWLVGVGDLLVKWSPGRRGEAPRSELITLATVLGKLGYGIEPDMRIASGRLPIASTALVFPIDESAPATASSEYATAVVLADLCAAVAHADGNVSEGERDHLLAHLERFLDLAPGEQGRLHRHIQWLTAAFQGLGSIRKRVERLTEQQRSDIGTCLVQVAGVDGMVTPEEIRILVKLFGWLGLDEPRVYGEIHNLGLGGDAAESQNAGHRRPATEPKSEPVRLDPKKIRARLAETEAVTSMLSAIFVSEDSPSSPPPPPMPQFVSGVGTSPLLGLEPAVAALADRLRLVGTLTRNEAERLATEIGIPFLDAALDRINDAALEHCGEPLVEGDDPLAINAYAAEEIYS